MAKKLRVSVSTLKRWLEEPSLNITDKRNIHGWRLFTKANVEELKRYKRSLRKNGKRFNDTTLIPVVVSGKKVRGI
ncbi:hypothetical protein CHISP_0917 [Chitinispirillum alkaliphilum]|nr:hypothetical protein CHISP_0917 [Chitinispirillum alkaliphilum]